MDKIGDYRIKEYNNIFYIQRLGKNNLWHTFILSYSTLEFARKGVDRIKNPTEPIYHKV